jgi:hypothetical protein
MFYCDFLDYKLLAIEGNLLDQLRPFPYKEAETGEVTEVTV